jgi:site-specific DNA-cytosine methylase
MNVLSLFDGMSCGQIALERAGFKVDNYFASEIKKIAIETTQLHYPNTKQLGDVTKVKASDLPQIDLLIGGSPCQDFSQGNKERKGLQGMKSKLFFEYLRLLDECKPKYWLLENVMMYDSDYMIISEYLNTEPVRINSNLVTAQHRDRYYWTNIGPEYFNLFGFRKSAIPQPRNKFVTLQSILTDGYTDLVKARCLVTNSGSSISNPDSMYKRYTTTGMVNIIFDSPDFDYKKGIRFLNNIEMERLQTAPEGYTKHLTDKQAMNLLGDGWTIDVVAHIFSYLNGFEKTEVRGENF